MSFKLFTHLPLLVLCAAIPTSLLPLPAMAARSPACSIIKAKPGTLDRINAMVDALVRIERGNTTAVRQMVLAIKREIESNTGITLDLSVCMIMVQKELKAQGVKLEQKAFDQRWLLLQCVKLCATIAIRMPCIYCFGWSIPLFRTT